MSTLSAIRPQRRWQWGNQSTAVSARSDDTGLSPTPHTHTPQKWGRGRGINMNYATKGGGSGHRGWREQNGSIDRALPVSQAHSAKHQHASWHEIREQNIGGWYMVGNSRSKAHSCYWVVSEHCSCIHSMYLKGQLCTKSSRHNH